MLQAELRILGGKHQGKSIPLSTKKFLVGREQDCHLRPNSDLVSRHHCVFSIDDYAVRLRDLGSTNGTRVNGKALHGETTLKAGDQIGIGKLELELVIRQRAEGEPAVPSGSPTSELTTSTLESVAETATVEIPSGVDQNPPETSFELPTQPIPTADTSTSLTADTAIIPNTAQPYPQYPPMQMPAPAYAPGYPGMPNYQQPMGYPPQAQPMGYPQYPGYAGGYAMPGYPMQMPYAGYPMTNAAPVAAPATPAATPDSSSGIAVKLPPPEATGVKAPEPPPAGTAAPTPTAGSEEKPSNSAADIIKNYMQRRTR